MKKRHFFLIVPLFLGLIYLVGPHPETPIYANDWPEINGDISTYVREHEALVSVKPDNEAEITWVDSVAKNKTKYVVLYLHGYAASKMEGQPVYQDFAHKFGCNTFAARLSEQGIASQEPMLEYNAVKLWNSAKEALAIAEKLGDYVIIMSTSTGGTLALKLAAEFPEKVFALINMSPNIHPKPWNAALLNNPWGLEIGRVVMRSNYRKIDSKDDNYRKYWYDKYRIESLVQMQDLVETTMTPETFIRVKCPVLNIYYYKDEIHQDQVIDVEKVIWMHKHLATPKDDKRIVAIENASSHVIGCGLYSQDIQSVENAIFSFSTDVLNLEPATLAN